MCKRLNHKVWRPPVIFTLSKKQIITYHLTCFNNFYNLPVVSTRILKTCSDFLPSFIFCCVIRMFPFLITGETTAIVRCSKGKTEQLHGYLCYIHSSFIRDATANHVLPSCVQTTTFYYQY